VRAESLFRRAVAIHEGRQTPDPAELGRSLSHLGAAYAAQRKLSDAALTLRRSLDLLEPHLGDQDPSVLETRKTYDWVMRAEQPAKPPASPALDL
jgi:hypothetical protein